MIFAVTYIFNSHYTSNTQKKQIITVGHPTLLHMTLITNIEKYKARCWPT